MWKIETTNLVFGGLLCVLSGAAHVSAQDLSQLSTSSSLRTIYPGKSYQLVSRESGLCLDVTDHSYTEGVRLQQWNCHGKANQSFRVSDAGDGTYHLQAEESRLFVKVSHSANGAEVVQSSDQWNAASQLLITPSTRGSFTVRFKLSGKCLDVADKSMAAGAKLQQWDCHGGPNQDWFLVEQGLGKGQLAWSADNSYLFVDSQKRLYRQDNSGNRFVAVDKASGRDHWSHSSNAYQTPYAQCNDPHRVFLLGDGKLKALNPSDGKVKWVFDSKDQAGSLFCPAGDGHMVLVSSRESEGRIHYVNRDNGQRKWEHKADGFPSFVARANGRVLISIYKGDKTLLKSLDANSGHVQWTREMNGDYPLATNKGDVIVSRTNEFSKVNLDNGKNAWTFYGNGDAYLGYNESGHIYARQGHEIIRLDSATGHKIWSHTSPEGAGIANSVTNILRNGDVIVRTEYGNGQATTKLYDPSGRKLWENQALTGTGWMAEDSAGKLFFRASASIKSLDRNSGAVHWSFKREFPIQGEALFNAETYGDDVYVLYGRAGGRYPPMGLIRLDARSGALQWDIWTNETTTLLAADAGYVFTNRVMNSGVRAYKR